MQNLSTQPQLATKALLLFRHSFRSGWFYCLLARLIHRRERLLELDEILRGAEVRNSRYAGMRAVEIKRIRGTEGKADEFDIAFHPLKEGNRSRWISIAIERLCKRDLPPVDLVEVDGVYYVRDGHHRISVARSLGQAYIDAEVISMTLNRRVM